MLTAALDRYMREHAEKKTKPDDIPPVGVPAPEILFPWHDPYVEGMRSICRDVEKMTEIQKEGCAILKVQKHACVLMRAGLLVLVLVLVLL